MTWCMRPIAAPQDEGFDLAPYPNSNVDPISVDIETNCHFLSDDGQTLINVTGTYFQKWDFPSLSFVSEADISADLDAVAVAIGGLTGGINVFAATGGHGDGKVLIFARIHDGSTFTPVLIETDENASAFSAVWVDPLYRDADAQIGRHQLDGDTYVYFTLADSFSNEWWFCRADIGTGVVTDLDYRTGDIFRPAFGGGLQRWSRGFTWMLYAEGANERILAYDIPAASLADHDTGQDMFVWAIATSPDDEVYWRYDDGSMTAVQVSAGPSFSVISPPCPDNFFVGSPGWDESSYPQTWLSETYISDSTNIGFIWVWEEDAPPPVVPSLQRPAITTGCVLGCPDTRVYLMDFCGGQTICDLTDHVTFLRWGRELDDDSEVEVTLHLTGDSAGRGCCECLEKARTWRNELMIVRGGEVVWGPGPIVTIGIQRHIAHLVARDITAWLDRRLVHTDYEFVETDMATVAETIVVDALTLGPALQLPLAVRDACILDYATFTETGKYTDVTIEANKRSAGEVLRELAQQGLDFTVINRSLIVGADFAFGPLGPLTDDDFAEDLLVSERGLAAATRWVVSSDNAQGQCGGPDDFFGLIERGIEGQPAATSVKDLNREACDRLEATNPPPLIVTIPSEGQLTHTAPVCVRELVPGTMIDVAINELCRPASVRERLTSVRFTLDERGERAGITLAPAGEFVDSEVQQGGEA